MVSTGVTLTTFNDSIFHSNSAKTRGGAITVAQDAQLVLQDSSVTENSAEYGGGVVATDNSILQLLGDTGMTGNKASKSGGALVVCPAGSFSLDPTDTSCSPCPANAECPGGDVIVPDAGYWHSARGSTQIHRCPNPLACTGGATTATEQCASGATGLNSSSSGSATPCSNGSSSFNPNMQCSANYQGNLCGVCAPGTGTLRAFTCYKCLEPRVLVGLYVLAVVVLLVFIKLLCHFTLADNYKASVQNVLSERDSTGNSESARMEVTDLIRPLVLYMQYTLIIFSLPLELPQFLARSIQALSWLWAPASPEAFNIECLVDKQHGTVHCAVAKVLFYLCMPIAIERGMLHVDTSLPQAVLSTNWMKPK